MFKLCKDCVEKTNFSQVIQGNSRILEKHCPKLGQVFKSLNIFWPTVLLHWAAFQEDNIHSETH